MRGWYRVCMAVLACFLMLSGYAQAQKVVVEFWSTDNEEARVAVYEKVLGEMLA